MINRRKKTDEHEDISLSSISFSSILDEDILVCFSFFFREKSNIFRLEMKIIVLWRKEKKQRWTMASCMYRVGGKFFSFSVQRFSLICLSFHLDYVYFEGIPSEPYLIRRIEELNKVRHIFINNWICLLLTNEKMILFRRQMEMSKRVSHVSFVVEIFPLI